MVISPVLPYFYILLYRYNVFFASFDMNIHIVSENPPAVERNVLHCDISVFRRRDSIGDQYTHAGATEFTEDLFVGVNIHVPDRDSASRRIMRFALIRKIALPHVQKGIGFAETGIHDRQKLRNANTFFFIVDLFCCFLELLLRVKGLQFQGNILKRNIVNGSAISVLNIAGSVATFDRLVRTMMTKTSCSLSDIITMSTYAPAKICGIPNKGLLKAGYDADVVIFDQDVNIGYTIIGGRIVYKG